MESKIIEQNEKSLALSEAKIKELEGFVEVGNLRIDELKKQLADKDIEINVLKASASNKYLIEKDKEIEICNKQAKKWIDTINEQYDEIAELKRMLSNSVALDSAWLAEYRKLKSEKARIPFEKRSSNPKNDCCPHCCVDIDFGFEKCPNRDYGRCLMGSVASRGMGD